MNFFLTSSVGDQTSGIEQSEIMRLNLFLRNHVDAAIVSTMYYSRFHYDFNKNGLDDAHSINLFDYFLGTLDVKFQKYGLAEFLKQENLSDPKSLGEEMANHKYVVQGYLAKYPDGRQAMIRIDKDTQQMDSVAYADANGNLEYSDVYDYRGFHSLRFEMDRKTKQVAKQTYFNLDGKKILEFYYGAVNKQQGLRRIVLNHGNELRMFANVPGIETYFYDTLNKQYGLENNFISDRYEVTPSLGAMKTKAYKYVFIHSNYTTDPDNANDPNLNYNYAYGIVHNELFNGLIVSTENEKRDLDNRFHLKHPVYAIPSGYVDKVDKQVPISDRHSNQIMTVARIAPEKRLDQLIRAFAKVHKAIPDAKLLIVGFIADPNSAKLLNQTITEQNVYGSVEFPGYMSHAQLNKLYDQSVTMTWTSRGEGFGLSLIEAQSHGVPVVAYDINYGPNEILKDDVNGYLVKSGDVDGLADRLIHLLKDDFLKQKLSTEAYKTSEKYSAENDWQKWQVLLKHENPDVSVNPAAESK